MQNPNFRLLFAFCQDGIMMTLERYIAEHAGKMTVQEATAKWQKLVDAPEAYVNFEGKSETGEVGLKQVRVATDQHVFFENIYDRAKRMKKKDVMKKATQQDAERLEKKLRTSHDDMLGLSTDLSDVAAGMVSEHAGGEAASSVTGAFAGQVQRLGNLDDLLQSEETKVSGEDADSGDEGCDVDGTSVKSTSEMGLEGSNKKKDGKPGKPGKPGKGKNSFFDERKAAAAARREITWLDEMTKKFKEVIGEMQSLDDQFKKATSDVQSRVAPEKAIMTTRLAFAELVVGLDSRALRQKQSEVNFRMKELGEIASSSGGRTGQRLGQGPPGLKYMRLQTLDALSQIVFSLQSVTSVNEPARSGTVTRPSPFLSPTLALQW